MLATINIGAKVAGDKLEVRIPHFRTDIEDGLEADWDIAEEVARLYGYYNIKPSLMYGDTFAGKLGADYVFEDKVKDEMAAQGCYEMYNYNFTGPAALDALLLDKDSEILLEESGQDRCLIENAPNGGRSRLFFDWKKGEGLYAAGALGKGGIHLEKTARCISHGVENELPYLISDRGYGILLASSKEVIFCSLPVYGNQICLEGTQQPDYYIIVGKKLETLLKACAYLCGKL